MDHIYIGKQKDYPCVQCEIIAALSRAEKAEAALCRAEDAVKASLNLVVGVGAFVAGYAPTGYSEGIMCPRKTVERFRHDIEIATRMIAARLDNAPCRHEAEVEDLKQQVKNLDEYVLKGVAFRDELQAEVERLEAQVREWNVIGRGSSVTDHGLNIADVARERDSLNTRVKQLEEAVEWALRILDQDPKASYVQRELRRRAGKGEG